MILEKWQKSKQTLFNKVGVEGLEDKNNERRNMGEGLRVKIDESGNVVISINDETETLNANQVTYLIDVLMCAQKDVKELLQLQKRRESLLKAYNTKGRTINDKG
jgi:uncharacterized protein YuzE